MKVADRQDTAEPTLTEKLVHINRVAKVVKGGKRFGFTALVVIGDGQGRVGYGIGKAKEVPEAIRKGGAVARKKLVTITMAGATIPYRIMAKYDASVVMLRPAAPGTGVIAAGGVRAVMEVIGIKDVLTKSLGSPNPINVVKATIKALSLLKNPREEMAKRKGVVVQEMGGRGG